MSSAKISLVALALFGLVAVSQAAGGIKGGLQQQGSIKSPFARFQQQQQYNLPPPPPPQQLLPPPPPPQPLFVPQQVAIKGPGQVTPVFSAARVAPAPPAAPIVVQQVQEPAFVPQQQQQQLIQVQEQEPEPVQQVQQQQVQQQQEIDPSAEAQDASPAIAAPARQAPSLAAQGSGPLVAAAGSEEEANPRPEPYAFQYAFDSGDSATSGSSQREEQQDANGRVTGFYTLKGEDGRDRRVDYVADASGFRATVSTNEMGTAPKDSADGKFQFIGQPIQQQQQIIRK